MLLLNLRPPILSLMYSGWLPSVTLTRAYSISFYENIIYD